VSDARETAGLLVDPTSHAEGCACLKRRTEQSGEVQCHGAQRAGEIRLAPAVPLTGFIPRPGYVPPKVIVSDLLVDLNLGPGLDVMLLELDRPAPIPTLAGPPTGELAPVAMSGRPAAAAHPPAPVSFAPRAPSPPPPPPVSFAPRAPAPPPPRFTPLYLETVSAARAPAPPPADADDDLLAGLEDFGFEP
jgi:hypothetical protein